MALHVIRHVFGHVFAHVCMHDPGVHPPHVHSDGVVGGRLEVLEPVSIVVFCISKSKSSNKYDIYSRHFIILMYIANPIPLSQMKLLLQVLLRKDDQMFARYGLVVKFVVCYFNHPPPSSDLYHLDFTQSQTNQ